MNFCHQAANILWRNAGLEPEETLYGYTRGEYAVYLAQWMEPIEVEIHTCVIDNGDGSTYTAFFKTKEGAESRSEYEERVFHSDEGAVGCTRLQVNASGMIVGGDLDYIGRTEDYEDIYES